MVEQGGDAMFEFLRALFRLFFNRNPRSSRPEVFDSERMRAEIDSHIRDFGGNRERDLQVMGSEAASDGIVWDREVLSYVDPESGETELRHTVAKRCSCGHFIGYDNVNVVGVCQDKSCENLVCGACVDQCSFCKKTFCGLHIYEIQSRKYCAAHMLIGLSRKFLGV
jgi:hypothetical protein